METVEESMVVAMTVDQRAVGFALYCTKSTEIGGGYSYKTYYLVPQFLKPEKQD